jgi:hypothetical protein
VYGQGRGLLYQFGLAVVGGNGPTEGAEAWRCEERETTREIAFPRSDPPATARTPPRWLVITRILSLAEPRNIRHRASSRGSTYTVPKGAKDPSHPLPRSRREWSSSTSAVTSSSRSLGEGGGEEIGMSPSWIVWESPAYHPLPLPTSPPAPSPLPFAGP